MIVQESDILVAALDRRLQVDPVLAIDPISRATGTPARPGSIPTGAPPAGFSTPDASTPLTARLPLGQLITARVVDVPQPDHVIAEVGNLRIALAWPKGNGIAPQPGRDIGLRVLAHQPMLLFQSETLDAPAATGHDGGPESLTRWSSDAMHLQPAGSASAPGTGIVRFDAPILDIEVLPLSGRGDHGADDLQHALARPSSSLTVVAGPARIALDDVIVARSTALVDGIDAPLIPRAIDDGPRVAAFVPLILQGPAWPGQLMELVVRRERKDEAFDNPALDHWCGEVLIDLPNLGRVAGHLAFSMQGLRIRLEGDDAAAVEAMTIGATELAHALGAANLRVSALSVGSPAADTRRPASDPQDANAFFFKASRGG